MPKYTQKQLKEMADDVLCAYNLGDGKADMLINLLSAMTQIHPQQIYNELNRMADYQGE